MSQATVELVLPNLVPPPPPPPPRHQRPAAPGPESPIRPGARPSAARAAAAARLAGADPEAAAVAATASPLAEPVPASPEEESGDQRPEGERHLRVVDTPKLSPARRRRRARALLFGGAGLMAAIAFGLVYMHVVLAQRQFTLDQLDTQVQQQQVAYQKLRLDVAELGSPQNIISTAVGKLGMQQPASVTYLQPTTTIGATASTTAKKGSASTSKTTVTAPAGDADWPQIKSQLAGSP